VEEVSIISIPLLNPNEREVSITAIHITEGQHVQSGQLICTIETTKSTADIEADQNGFILNFQFGIGDTASAGDILCYIADNPDWNPETDEASKVHMFSNGEVIDFDFSIPDGLKITIPALETKLTSKTSQKIN
jgi:pyruvate/2-oxoglutarate dehydrogenase complex dihydrolipoamide acyltransferase (E2) component